MAWNDWNDKVGIPGAEIAESLTEGGPPSTAESLIEYGRALAFSETVNEILAGAEEEGVTVPQAAAMRRMATEALGTNRPVPVEAWRTATGLREDGALLEALAG